jgi:hypothetical protein
MKKVGMRAYIRAGDWLDVGKIEGVLKGKHLM